MSTGNSCKRIQNLREIGIPYSEFDQVLTFRLGELFSGPGGIAYGALQSKAQCGDTAYKMAHAWASDYDLSTCRTYRRNICPAETETVYCEDARSLDTTKLSPIDAFAFGFPCNDFSLVGEKKGINGAFGPLYSYGIDVINRFKPKFFVAENVRCVALDPGIV
jgi:DNA (cytosine-5)-methyltransferase 1